MFIPVSKRIMTTNSSSMTISPGSDTKGAAKQVTTFFFSFGGHAHCKWNLLISSRTKVNCTRIGGMLQKKVNTCIAAPKCVRTLPRHP